MNKNFNLFLKKKSIYQIIFYLLVFFVASFFFYFFIPNFFNYSPQIIEENFKRNHSINIKNISKINYKVFPTPRLTVFGSNLSLKENILSVEESEIEIILKPSRILNYKKLYYNKIIIKGGSTKIKTNDINQLLNYFKKNKLIILLKKNNIILVKNNKSLFEINDSKINISLINNQHQLSINGIFLNHKMIFLLNSKLGEGSNITIKIPKLDILSRIYLKNKDSFGFFNGLVNFEVLNNFFQFNFTKEKNIKVNKGYIRNNLTNLLFNGEITLKPNFFLNLTLEPKIFNIEQLFPIIQKEFFSKEVQKLELIKKINGFFVFKKIFQGNVVSANGEILFKNFKIGENNPIFFDARISEFGKKGKIHFNILKIIPHKINTPKKLIISGFMIPSTSKISFEKIIFNEKNYRIEKIKFLEEKFKNKVIQKSLSNAFNKDKMNNFFKDFEN